MGIVVTASQKINKCNSWRKKRTANDTSAETSLHALSVLNIYLWSLTIITPHSVNQPHIHIMNCLVACLYVSMNELNWSTVSKQRCVAFHSLDGVYFKSFNFIYLLIHFHVEAVFFCWMAKSQHSGAIIVVVVTVSILGKFHSRSEYEELVVSLKATIPSSWSTIQLKYSNLFNAFMCVVFTFNSFL